VDNDLAIPRLNFLLHEVMKSHPALSTARRMNLLMMSAWLNCDLFMSLTYQFFRKFQYAERSSSSSVEVEERRWVSL